MLTRQITNDDGSVERMPLTSIPLTIVSGNGNSRVYFDKGFVEGEENQSPVCFSHDGKTPGTPWPITAGQELPGVPARQVGQQAPHRQRRSQGAPRARRAPTGGGRPEQPTTPFLLNLPPASRPLLSAEIKKISAFGKGSQRGGVPCRSTWRRRRPSCTSRRSAC